MRVLIVGAGAVGGYFGALLAETDAEVSFLVRPARRERLIEHGLRVQRAGGPVQELAVRAVTADTLSGSWDLVLLAVKGTALDAAIADISPAVGDHTLVLPLLNGIDHIARLREHFGHQVLGGVAVVATTQDDDGTIRQLMPGGSITFGPLHEGLDEQVDAIAAAFARADFASAVSDDIEQDMWDKWLFMAAGGAATVLLGGPVGAIVAVPDGARTVQDVLAEGIAVFEAAGHPARDTAVASTRTTLTTPGSPFTTSMYRDFVAGRGTEVEPILGDLIGLAGDLGVATPLLTAATVRLRVHNASQG
ncbi:ketopantoate reductase family protein [Curtobacterium sp. 22159]|uniref:ketopantoate reductase family protein n=1 Tax=Curtobacterium sp. 22159 TaxID=3453882 RepID=UPI003F848395